MKQCNNCIRNRKIGPATRCSANMARAAMVRNVGGIEIEDLCPKRKQEAPDDKR